MSVILGLERSSKGRLDYEDKLRNQSSVQKLHLLDTYNGLPSLTTEIESFLAKQAIRTVESPSCESLDELAHTFEDAVDHVPERPSPDTVGSLSLITEINNERYEYEESLDDLLLKEANVAVEEKRKWFHQQLQVKAKICRDRLDLQHKEEQRKWNQIQETRQLSEIRMSVVIQEWKRKTLAEYKAEEERIEAKLADGELQARRISMLKDKQMKAQCKQCQMECELLGQEFTTCLQSCRYPQNLQKSMLDRQGVAIADCQGLQASFLTLEQSGSHLHQNKVNDLHGHFSMLKLLLEHVKVAVQEANVLGAEQEQQEIRRRTLLEMERKLKEEEEERKRLKEKSSEQKLQVAQEQTKEVSLPSPSGGKNNDDQDYQDLGMPKSVVSTYTKLQEMLSCTSSSTSSFSGSKDARVKKYRFDLQKAVNITVNSISANSGEGLLEKISRLRTLMGGHSVDVMGKPVDILQHPEAKLYCCNLLAKKLVKQGEDQVSSSSEAAFPLAAVAIGLWSKYPDFGQHILAHFHSVCPCLVPLYIQKTRDMSDADHMKLQGYKVSKDGKIETEDMFLHRVRGIVRFYAAIVSSLPPPLDQVHSHPHGLNHGWMWLARMMNTKPHPTLTAAALGDFLEIAGHALMKKFGRQFKKLLYTLITEYVPKMEKWTPSSQRGPISRLTQFLETCITSGTFPEPKGYLRVEFWRTRSKGIAFA